MKILSDQTHVVFFTCVFWVRTKPPLTRAKPPLTRAKPPLRILCFFFLCIFHMTSPMHTILHLHHFHMKNLLSNIYDNNFHMKCDFHIQHENLVIQHSWSPFSYEKCFDNPVHLVSCMTLLFDQSEVLITRPDSNYTIACPLPFTTFSATNTDRNISQLFQFWFKPIGISDTLASHASCRNGRWHTSSSANYRQDRPSRNEPTIAW